HAGGDRALVDDERDAGWPAAPSGAGAASVGDRAALGADDRAARPSRAGVAGTHGLTSDRYTENTMMRLVWLALVVLLVACDRGAPKVADPYDPAAMDLKPKPARVTNATATGPYAAGSALSMTAALKPLDPAPVKDVRLDTIHKIIEIAPGVKYSA